MSSTAPRLLPHQLVSRDGRSSYIKRVDTVAGPGAYAIPSTFKTMEMNPQVREIHKQQYGREFARQQRRMSGGSASETGEGFMHTEDETEQRQHEQRDQYLLRRERLRELLENLDEHQDQSNGVDAVASAAPTLVVPLTGEALPQSPSLSYTSNYEVFVEGYRQHQHGRRNSTSSNTSARSCTHTMSLRSPTSPTSCDLDSVGFGVASPRVRQGSSPNSKQGASLVTTSQAVAVVPLTYREYLSTTSYQKRLVKHCQPKRRPQDDHSTRGSSARPPVHRHATQ